MIIIEISSTPYDSRAKNLARDIAAFLTETKKRDVTLKVTNNPDLSRMSSFEDIVVFVKTRPRLSQNVFLTDQKDKPQ